MVQLERARRKNGRVMEQHTAEFEENGQRVELEYLTFPLLERTGIVRHLFTTRTGGVSEGCFASLNLSFDRGDDPERVLRNYERVGRVLGCGTDHMVASKQTHTTNIRHVTGRDCGKGVVKPRDYENIDGLITSERGIALVTFFADCVPLYFVDPVRKAIGLAHSGWRGTARQMGACMVRAMQEQFGSRPEELTAAIGPSICQDCYEVDGEVADSFAELLAAPGTEEMLEEICAGGYCAGSAGAEIRILKPLAEPGKYQLDLWLANLLILRRAGVLPEHMAVTDICTCHNPAYLFSHRASRGKRGNLGAFLMLCDQEGGR